jgi:hypothetical protein
LYQEHLEQAAEARKKYYKHNEKARHNPDKYASFIFDGMTQATTEMPRVLLKPKWLSKDTKLAVHNMGGMLEGYHPVMEFTTANILNGANALVDTVHRAIARVSRDLIILTCVYRQFE